MQTFVKFGDHRVNIAALADVVKFTPVTNGDPTKIGITFIGSTNDYFDIILNGQSAVDALALVDQWVISPTPQTSSSTPDLSRLQAFARELLALAENVISDTDDPSATNWHRIASDARAALGLPVEVECNVCGGLGRFRVYGAHGEAPEFDEYDEFENDGGIDRYYRGCRHCNGTGKLIEPAERL